MPLKVAHNSPIKEKIFPVIFAGRVALKLALKSVKVVKRNPKSSKLITNYPKIAVIAGNLPRRENTLHLSVHMNKVYLHYLIDKVYLHNFIDKVNQSMFFHTAFFGFGGDFQILLWL